MRAITLTEEETTAASRIFIKILLQDIAENLGVENFTKKIDDEQVKPHLGGLFPKTSVDDARFAINFYTTIGLGALTLDLREFMANAPKLLLE